MSRSFAFLTMLLFIVEQFPAMNVPDIFLIGAGKCGSTSLHDLIVKHSEICPSKVKEFHYFSGNDYTPKRREWYEKQFQNRSGCAVGAHSIDGTPRYIRSTIAPQRIKDAYSEEELKNKKFILVLREPVSREFSWYRHRLRSCVPAMKKGIQRTKPATVTVNSTLVYTYDQICKEESCRVLGCKKMPATLDLLQSPQKHLYTFEQYIQHTPSVYTDSAYVQQIRHWLKYIPRKQLFIMNTETLQQNTTDTMHRLSKFLQFKTDWGNNVILPHKNENRVEANMSCISYDRLHQHYAPLNKALYRLLNTAGDRPPSEPAFPKFAKTRDQCTD